MADQTPRQAEAERIFAEAARWQIRLRDRDAPAQAHEDFALWLGRDPRHLDAYDRAGALWQAMAPTAPHGPRDEAAIAALLDEARPRRGRRLIGVGALVVLLALGAWAGPGVWQDLGADQIAPIGQRQQLVLADGTRIELNSGAALAVDYGPGERRVRLLRGEAFFDVAHRPAPTGGALPFTVDLPEGRVRVTGTRFNIDLTEAGAEVGLVSGSVRLSAREAGAETVLAPGQQALLGAAGVEPVTGFDAAAATVWRQGRMEFYRAPLSQVIGELRRYQRGGILLLNRRAAALPVTGAFATDDPQAVLALIAGSLGLSLYHLAGVTVIR